MSESLITQLKHQFRLNIYEAKIWTSLLSRGIASAGELADISGVPRSRCYDVLESLEKKGFIIMKIGKPIKYIGVKPEVIVERVKNDIELEAQSQLTSLNAISDSDAFKELELLHKSGIDRVDVNDISRSVVGRVAINKQVKDMLKSANSEVIVVANEQTAERTLKPLKSVVPLLQKKGVDVTVHAPVDKKTVRKVGDVKFNSLSSQSTFVSIDNNQMVFMVTPSSTVPEYEVALWIDSPFFVNAMNTLFKASVKQ